MKLIQKIEPYKSQQDAFFSYAIYEKKVLHLVFHFKWFYIIVTGKFPKLKIKCNKY